METLSRDSTDLCSQIEGLFSEESPCENSNHDHDPNHEGPGRWYLTAKTCGNCGMNRGVRIVCDSFAQYLLNGGPIACGKCRNLLGYGRESFKSITWKG